MKRRLISILMTFVMVLSLFQGTGIRIGAGEAAQVKVTYMNGDQQYGDFQTINPGETATKPEVNPEGCWTAGDYPFHSWRTENGDEWSFDTPVTGDLTLYACYSMTNAIIFGYSTDTEGKKVYGLFECWDECHGGNNDRIPLAYVPIENDGTWSVDQPSQEGELPVLHLNSDFEFSNDVMPGSKAPK